MLAYWRMPITQLPTGLVNAVYGLGRSILPLATPIRFLPCMPVADYHTATFTALAGQARTACGVVVLGSLLA